MAFARVLLAAMVLGTVPGTAAQDMSAPVPLVRLKPADPEMRRLISDGFQRSATFRALVDAIHQTNAIVVVQMGLCANGRFRSCVTHVAGDARSRSVRIKVNTRTTDDRLIATVAHELQHVLEMMNEPSVVDAASALALYRRIGIGACGKGLSDACETDGALAAESNVLDELSANGRRR
jgi:hypothetical protein